MAKTAKAKPTKNGTTSRKTAVRTKSNNNELPSSPRSRVDRAAHRGDTNELPSSPRSRADRAAHRGALLNPTDVDDPALSAVNPSVSEINYDVLS